MDSSAMIATERFAFTPSYAPQLTIAITLSIILISFSFHWIWREETKQQISTMLLEEVNEQKRRENIHKVSLTKDLPLVALPKNVPYAIERYLKASLALIPSTLDNANEEGQEQKYHVKFARSLTIKQEGSFLLNGKWIPFTAHQVFSSSSYNPGFVWDAQMNMTPNIPFLKIPINVRDSYVQGVGTMEAKLMSSLKLVRVSDDPEINQGEIMRWFAEAAALFPTALLPLEGNGITWIEMAPTLTPNGATETNDGKLSRLESTLMESSNTAIAEYIDPFTKEKTSLELRFDKEGMISSIYGMRPMAVGDGTTKLTPWEGYFHDFEIHGGMRVPTRMEVGWWVDGNLSIYFKGKNTKFEYELE